MDNKIKARIDQVYWSAFLYNTSVTELQILSNEIYTNDEIKIVNSHTFSFYRVTLQYCFIMEYCKLLENGNKNGDTNICSLKKLNELILYHYTKSYEDLYYQNNNIILKIKDSDFYDKIRKLRDKKFGHADNHEINKPYNITGLRKEDFENAFEHLKMIKEILNNFGSVYDKTFSLEIPSRENRTKNFIKFHAEYKNHYMKNFKNMNIEQSNSKSNDY